MKKTHYLFLLLLLLPFLGKAQNWQALGPDDFNQLSAGEIIKELQISTSTGVPYIAYAFARDKYSINPEKFKLKKYANNKWETVVEENFSDDPVNQMTIGLNGATSYVAYTDQNTGKLTVKMHTGTSWETLGTENFTNSNTQSVVLDFNGTVPYVMYKDQLSNNKFIIKKYNGTSWIAVTDPDISIPYYGTSPNIAFAEGVPYIAYTDYNDNNQIKVKKYNSANSSWELVGNLNISNVLSNIAGDGAVPYILTSDDNSLTMRKFDGINWVTVGNTNVVNANVKGANLGFDGTVPYVIYKEGSFSNAKTVLKKLKADGSGWETIGDLGFLSSSDSGGGMPGDGASDPMGIAFIDAKPYVTYLAGGSNGKALLKHFDGTSWKAVGATGFSAGDLKELTMSADDITPYVAYRDLVNGGKLTVKKHNGFTWQTVGTEGFSSAPTDNGNNISLAFKNKIPFVAYSENTSLVVKRYQNNTWENVGTNISGTVYDSANSLASDGSTLYIAYNNPSNNNKLNVKKFDEVTETWKVVGNTDFSNGGAYNMNMAFNGNVPYVVYEEGNSHKIIVKKLANNVWETAGDTDFSGSYAKSSQIAFNNNIPYIVYIGNTGITVRKLNSDNQKWEQIGVGAIATTGAQDSKLLFVGDILYVTYKNADNSKINVRKFNGTTWESVGDADFAGELDNPSIVSNGASLIIAYASGGAFAKRFTFSTSTVATNSIVYVTETGAGTKEGSSWSNATADLQKAMQSSTANVYVASGTYKPVYPAQTDFSTAYMPNPGSRDNAFVLVKDKKVYGGFSASNPEASPQLRDTSATSANKTILSGDFLGNDPNEFDITQPQTTFDDNTYHVLIAAGDLGTAVLNSFTVSSGYAADKDSNAALESEDGVTVNAVTAPYFSGGGILAVSSSPAFRNLILRNNFGFKGAAVATVANGNPKLTNLTINGNFGAAGVIYAHNSNPVLTNVAITQNLSQAGGMFNRNSNPTLTNVTIAGNTFGNSVTGIFNIEGSNPIIRNSIINGITNDNSIPVISYSLIGGSEGSGANWKTETGTDGGNNIDGDPIFRDATTGNYKLQAGSPAINAGSDSFFASNETPDLSGITFDLAGNLRMNGTLDMGAYEYEGTLPVTLVNFIAKAETNGAKIIWQTASEQNSKSFTISRSTDGVNFTAITTVNSKGNGNSLSNYTFVDVSPANGINYYLLQQIDTDGNTNDLGVRSVEFKLAQDGISVYPNPTADVTNIKFNAGTFSSATLIDLTGKILAQQLINGEQTETQFNLSTYTTGTYVIRLVSAKESRSYKIVKF